MSVKKIQETNMPTNKNTEKIIPETKVELFKDLEVSDADKLEEMTPYGMRTFFDVQDKPEYHPISKGEPMMTQQELKAMADDMENNGFDKKHPVLMYEKKILDGRNRTVAAKSAGVKVITETFTGTYQEAEAESIKLNNLRRHKTPSQKAMAAAYIIKANEARRSNIKRDILSKNPIIGKRKLSNQTGQNCPLVSNASAAKQQGCSVQSVKNAKTLMQCDEDLASKVFNGDISITEGQKRYLEMEEIKNRRAAKDGDYSLEEMQKFEEMKVIEKDPEGAYLKLQDKDKSISDLLTKVGELTKEVVSLKEKVKSMEDAPVKTINKKDLALSLKD